MPVDGSFDRKQDRCVLEETAEVLAAAGRPGEDAVVTGQSGRHNVALRLLANVAFTIVHHPKAEGGKETKKKANEFVLHSKYHVYL